MAEVPEIDPAAPVQFVVNAAAGSSDAATMGAVIESVLQAEGRLGELQVCTPLQLPDVARDAARRAVSTR